ncbi:hypothetical protein [Rhizobium sp. ZPR3]|uniref:Uncharacterized protein n=2 Tax=unclassified Rhizobium TaxID=2613769 RepID=A0AAU7SHK9_9HYPH
MREDEIPLFVAAVIESGCDICAVGHDLYLIGDADLSEEALEEAEPKLRDINRRFGERDFLRLQIVAYLRSIGRYLDVGSGVSHWSENPPLH